MKRGDWITVKGGLVDSDKEEGFRGRIVTEVPFGISPLDLQMRREHINLDFDKYDTRYVGGGARAVDSFLVAFYTINPITGEKIVKDKDLPVLLWPKNSSISD